MKHKMCSTCAHQANAGEPNDEPAFFKLYDFIHKYLCREAK